MKRQLPTRPLPTRKKRLTAPADGQAASPLSGQAPLLTVAAQPPATTPAEPRRSRLYLALLGGALGLALCIAGEWIVESKDSTQLSMWLYLLGIAIFAASAWLLPRARVDTPVEGPGAERPQRGRRWITWAIMGVGVAVSLGLALAGIWQVRQNIDSESAVWLWVGGIAAIMLTGIALGKRQGWAARWGEDSPRPRGRWLWVVVGVIGAILLVATLARVLWLDTLPLGINADEGDRAATSIQVLRGQNDTSIFGDGWYFISMVYFRILAWFMGIVGIGFVQARLFGAIASILSVAVITWIGTRHFGWRTGLLAGAFLALLGISLQFARETTEATPTALLWALSTALLMEGARTGRSWAWIGAGLAGAFSIYFYPTGRLWAVFFGAFALYILLHGLGGRRVPLLRGLALTSIAAFIIAGPYLSRIQQDPTLLTIRASETSIFTGDNPTRLGYYKPEWNTPQLLAAQVERGIGVFNQYGENGGFWPTERPLMWGLLAVLTLLGIGWVSTRWRDPRSVLLAIHFWVGLSGVIVTVETPNVQRMAVAIPLLGLFPALVLDNLARRIEAIFVPAAAPHGAGVTGPARGWRSKVPWATGGIAALVAAFLIWGQATFYFDTYAKVDRWPFPTAQGLSVNEQGTGTLVTTIGRQFHMINAGWVRLLAPFTPRGGIANPGTHLPLHTPADKDLAFQVFAQQSAYLPYLNLLYPGGTLKHYTHPTEHLMFSIYRVPREQWAARQGATAQAGGVTERVATLGATPSSLTSFPARVRWTAGLWVPRYWNYAFRAPQGARDASLTISGVNVFDASKGAPQAMVSLARGYHAVQYEATISSAEQNATLEWMSLDEPMAGDPAQGSGWAPARTENLDAGMGAPQGLLAAVRFAPQGDQVRPEQRRLDGTLAFCCLVDQLRPEGAAFEIEWSGYLTAPVSGVYSMSVNVQGVFSLEIGGKTVIQTSAPSEEWQVGEVTLEAGRHPVRALLRGRDSPSWLEWAWAPPDSQKSIVPPTALSPPEGGAVGQLLTAMVLGTGTKQPPADSQLDVTP